MAFTLTNALAGDAKGDGWQIPRGGTITVDILTKSMLLAKQRGDITVSPATATPLSGMSLVLTAVSTYVDATRVIGHPGDATALRSAIATMGDAINKLVDRLKNLEDYVQAQQIQSAK